MRSSVTVLTPASSHDLTVVGTLKAELKIAASDRTKDARLLSLIRQATDRINAECGRPFGKEAVSETFWLDSCENPSVLVLNRRPVVSPVDSVTEGVDSVTVLEATDYTLVNPERGILARGSGANGWSGWRSSKIVVVYTGGFTLLNELPQNIERACLDLAAHYYHTSGRDQTVTAVNIPDVGSRNYASPAPGGALPPGVLDLLRPYRKVA